MVTNSTLSGLFAAVVLTAGATFVAWNIQGRQSDPPPRLLLPRIDRFDTFEFRSRGLDLACDRTDEGWTMRRPVAGRADQAVVKRFLDAISTAAVRETQTERDMQRRSLTPESLGMPPDADDRPRLVLGRGEESVEMTFGTNVIDGRLYVEFNRHPGRIVHAVDAKLADELPTSATPFRDHHLLPYPPERLRRLEIRDGATITAMEIGTNDVWQLRLPFEARADEEKIRHTLKYLSSQSVNTLSDLPASEIAPEAALRGCSPDDAILTARLWYSSIGNAMSFRTATLLFGENAEDRQYIYTAIPEEHFLATVDTNVVQLLRGLERVRDLRLFPGRHADELVTLRVTRETGQSVTFGRGDDGTWSLVLPVPHPALHVAVNSFAESLLGLADEGVVLPDAAPDAVVAEVPKPFATLVFEFQDGPGVATVTASVARVEQADADAPPDSGGTVWTLPQGPARRVAAQAPGELPWWDETAVFSLLDPEILPDDGTGAPLVAERIESIAPLSVEPYGLLEPAATVVIPGTDAPLLLGDTAPDGSRFAMLRGGYTVYAIAPETVARLLGN